MAYSADILILGGLPVTVEFTVQPREPEVGIFEEWVEEWWITHVNGRKYKGNWLDKRISKDEREDVAVRLQETGYRQNDTD